MAVQAQYPLANLLLLNRAEPEKKTKDMEFPPASLLDQSPMFFPPNGGIANPRKRAREVAPTQVRMPAVLPPTLPQQQQHSFFSLQAPAVGQTDLLPLPPMMSLAQLQSPAPPVVSTGLRLALDEQSQRQQSDSLLPTFLSEEVSALINQQREEIEQFLLAQGEQLRRALGERRQRHYRTFIGEAEKSIGRRLREKEAEVERAVRRTAELEDRLARLRAESTAWQAKAMAEQASAASLHAQLQQASAFAVASMPAGEDRSGESPAEDAESVYVDPERPEAPDRACRICRRRLASVVIIPCRHLCLCPDCDSAGAGQDCPVCGCGHTGSVQICWRYDHRWFFHHFPIILTVNCRPEF
ncbi:hypothetical protein AXF42_Ash010024 [Apostasia shenzhenica]|uniref:RING-type domain-containing protein n=1 Tax=Apostasia shenzhenica TaxID=1088818 RepID=A0A2I0ACM0_9ASPA|nr:hypothetical protein AXF42_Ash010024 [Apostasia shenzhenica]